jgi:hypothetical protein
MNLWLSSMTNCYHLLYIVFSFYRVFFVHEGIRWHAQRSSFHLIVVATIFSVCNIIMHVIVNFFSLLCVWWYLHVQLSNWFLVDHILIRTVMLLVNFKFICSKLLVLEAVIKEQGHTGWWEATRMTTGRHGGRTRNHLPELQLLLLLASMLPSCRHCDLWGLSSTPFMYFST